MKKRLRIHYVTRMFQWKYAVLSLILALAVALLVGYTYKKNGLDYLIQKISNVYPVEQTFSIKTVVNKNLAIRLGLISPVIVIFSLLLSHKIAGPLSRIVQGIHRIGEGDFNVRIKLRRGDELLDLAEGINDIAIKIGDMVTQQKISIAELRQKIVELKNLFAKLSIPNEEISNSLDGIEHLASRLENTLLLTSSE